MADHGVAPDEICDAVENEESFATVATVRYWLDTDSDANASATARGGGPLLLLAARWGRTRILDLLLSRGADVDATDAYGRTAVYEMLNHWYEHRSLPALRVLLSHGADVNLARVGPGVLRGMSPLMCTGVSGGPDMARLLLRAGADPEQRDGGNCTAEESYRLSRGVYAEQCADLLRDVRLAGGWVRYALQPHYDLLVLRALCHRRRATFDSWTPEVLVRLFGAPEARRRNNAVRGRTDLPDPLFWRVLEFSLGPAYDYPWVRERVRARAAAVAAAE